MCVLYHNAWIGYWINGSKGNVAENSNSNPQTFVKHKCGFLDTWSSQAMIALGERILFVSSTLVKNPIFCKINYLVKNWLSRNVSQKSVE